MGLVFLTSDTHFDHQLVATLRGFATPAEHDAALVQTWNEVVSPEDTVWHLGDVGMGPMRRWEASVRALNGTIHLITGNHDDAAPGVSRRSHRVQREWLEVFASVQPFARVRRGKQNALLSHYPYTGEGEHKDVERFMAYRLRNDGFPLIHGHTHDPNQKLTFDRGTPMFHVGWDAWHKPVALDVALDALFAGADPSGR